MLGAKGNPNPEDFPVAILLSIAAILHLVKLHLLEKIYNIHTTSLTSLENNHPQRPVSKMLVLVGAFSGDSHDCHPDWLSN